MMVQRATDMMRGQHDGWLWWSTEMTLVWLTTEMMAYGCGCQQA
jgi:hypothetical protein